MRTVCTCGEVVILPSRPDGTRIDGNTTHRLTGPCRTGMPDGVKISLSDDLTWTTGEWERVEKYYEELNPGKEFTALYAKEQHDWRAAYRLKGLAAAGSSAGRPPRLSAEEISMGQYAVKDDDPVHHPSHYTDHPSGVECIQITEHMSFLRGNAMKYLWRAGKKKDAIVDLEKARWYIDREIQKLKTEWENRDRTGEA